MADKIRKIVSPEGIKEAKNELAHLFRMICWELGIGPNEWEYKLRKYLELTEASIPRNAKDRSYARGNLNAQLMDKKMTWTTFMRGLKFLGVTKINFAVSLTHPSGKVTEHRMGIRTRLTAEDLSLAETEVSLPRTPKARYVATLEQASGETTKHAGKIVNEDMLEHNLANLEQELANFKEMPGTLFEPANDPAHATTVMGKKTVASDNLRQAIDETLQKRRDAKKAASG
jgi:hypothetical protein